MKAAERIADRRNRTVLTDSPVRMADGRRYSSADLADTDTFTRHDFRVVGAFGEMKAQRPHLLGAPELPDRQIDNGTVRLESRTPKGNWIPCNLGYTPDREELGMLGEDFRLARWDGRDWVDTMAKAKGKKKRR